MPISEMKGVRFRSNRGLAAFCQTLRDWRVPYTLGGARIVIISTMAWRRLKGRAAVLERYRHKTHTPRTFAELSAGAQTRYLKRRLGTRDRLRRKLHRLRRSRQAG